MLRGGRKGYEWLVDEFGKLLVERVRKGAWIVIEDQIVHSGVVGYAVARSGKLIKLAHLAGAYWGLSLVHLGGCGEVRWLVPLEWKGNLPKEVCRIRVETKIGREVRNHNEVDAIGMGLHVLGTFSIG